jgi:TM2 domain-containing membrane protein YozV
LWIEIGGGRVILYPLRAKVEPNSKFCPGCGRATPLTIAQEAPSTVPKRSFSKSRIDWAYVLGFFITGVGHMLVGRVARGIVILLGAVFIGFVTVYISVFLWIIVAIGYWIFQYYDLHKIIKKLKAEQQSRQS